MVVVGRKVGVEDCSFEGEYERRSFVLIIALVF